jgi:hypothetical protein
MEMVDKPVIRYRVAAVGTSGQQARQFVLYVIGKENDGRTEDADTMSLFPIN